MLSYFGEIIAVIGAIFAILAVGGTAATLWVQLNTYLASAKVAAEEFMGTEPNAEQRKPFCDQYKGVKAALTLINAQTQRDTVDEILAILKCDEV